MRLAIAFIAVVAGCGAAAAADSTCRMSSAADVSGHFCRDWRGARTRGDSARVNEYVAWFGGYLTARNFYAPGSTLPLTNEALAPIVDQYCADGDKPLLLAVEQLTNALGGAFKMMCKDR
jgi:hypothetical protein